MDYVYIWVDSIVRFSSVCVSARDQPCWLVLVGVGMRADGRKEFVAISDGYWESAESWAAPSTGLVSIAVRSCWHEPNRKGTSLLGAPSPNDTFANTAG